MKKILAIALMGTMILGSTTVFAASGSFTTSGGTKGTTRGYYTVGTVGSAYDQGYINLSTNNNVDMQIYNINVYATGGFNENDAVYKSDTTSLTWYGNTYAPGTVDHVTCTMKVTSTIFGSWQKAVNGN